MRWKIKLSTSHQKMTEKKVFLKRKKKKEENPSRMSSIRVINDSERKGNHQQIA